MAPSSKGGKPIIKKTKKVETSESDTEDEKKQEIKPNVKQEIRSNVIEQKQTKINKPVKVSSDEETEDTEDTEEEIQMKPKMEQKNEEIQLNKQENVRAKTPMRGVRYTRTEMEENKNTTSYTPRENHHKQKISVLNYSYEDVIRELQDKKCGELQPSEIIQYLIARTNGLGQTKVVSILRQLLQAMNGEEDYSNINKPRYNRVNGDGYNSNYRQNYNQNYNRNQYTRTDQGYTKFGKQEKVARPEKE